MRSQFYKYTLHILLQW